MRTVTWIALVGAVALLAQAGLVRAQTSRATGAIIGKVVDENGKPVIGMALNLVLSEPAVAPQSIGIQIPADSPAGPRLLAERTVDATNTDEKGQFAFSGVTAGAYLIKGGSKEKGFVYIEIKLKAGETFDAGTLKLVKIQEPAPNLSPG